MLGNIRDIIDRRDIVDRILQQTNAVGHRPGTIKLDQNHKKWNLNLRDKELKSIKLKNSKNLPDLNQNDVKYLIRTTWCYDISSY